MDYFTLKVSECWLIYIRMVSKEGSINTWIT